MTESVRGDASGESPDCDFVASLRRDGFECIDKRANGGCLWIVDADGVADYLESAGVSSLFRYSSRGGKANKYRSAWWASARALECLDTPMVGVGPADGGESAGKVLSSGDVQAKSEPDGQECESLAHSVIAIGFSEKTCRFLHGAGIETVQSLLNATPEYFEINGADDQVKSEIADSIEIAAFLGITGKSDEMETFDHQADKAEMKSPLKIPVPQFDHVDFGQFAASLSHGAKNSVSMIDSVASALFAEENSNIVVHSSDANVLRELSEAVSDRYEELSRRDSGIGTLFRRLVSDLPLSKRSQNVLKNNGIRTTGDLCNVGENGVFSMRNAGVGVIEDITRVLNNVDKPLAFMFKIGTRDEPWGSICDRGCDVRTAVMQVRELPIDVDGLSKKSRRFASKNKLSTVNDVLVLGREGIRHLKNSNAAVARELYKRVQYQAKWEMSKRVNATLGRYQGRKLGEPQDSIVSRRIGIIRGISNTAVPSPLIVEQLESKGLGVSEIRHSILESLIAKILGLAPWGLSSSECTDFVAMEVGSTSEKEVLLILESFAKKMMASDDDGIWTLVEPSPIIVICSRAGSVRDGNIAVERINGSTLQEIAERHSLSRERIRQICDATLVPDILRGTRSGRYLELMRRYDLGQRETEVVLGASEQEWACASAIKRYSCKDDPKPLPAGLLSSNVSLPERVRTALNKELLFGGDE